MEIAEHVAAVRREGEILAARSAETDLDAPVPTCPGWVVRDLVRHVGDVHRWATAQVAEARAEPIGRDELIRIAGPLPDDADLIDWFRVGHARLVATLESADPGLRCWTFLPAPSPLAFWARRQAHETTVHRVDAESAAGQVAPLDPALAVDGVDELLFGFFGRPGRGAGPDARTLHLHATDAEGEWVVRLGTEGIETDRGHGHPDCSVRGTASDLDLLLWNRRSADDVELHGDASVLSAWEEHARITWSRDREDAASGM